jgi:hypothetical protein
MESRAALAPALHARRAASALADFAQIGLNADDWRQIELLGQTGQNGFQFAQGIEIEVGWCGSSFNGGCRIFNQQAGVRWRLADPEGQLIATLAQGV